MDRPKDFHNKMEIERKKLEVQNARDRILTEHDRYLDKKNKIKERGESLVRGKDGKDRDKVPDR